MTSKRTSQLCPNCGRLINVGAESCVHCGLAHPCSRWKNNRWLAYLKNADASLIPLLIVVNAALYVLSLLLNPESFVSSQGLFSFLSPTTESLVLLGASGTLPIDGYHRWWSLLAANYLHGSLLHILFNMMALRDIGPLVIQEFGVSRTIVIYTLGGIACYLASYFAGVELSIGASGAICALIGAALYYGKSRGGVYGSNVYRQTGNWVAMIFLFGFIVPGINNWGHGGGLLGGLALGWLLGYREKRSDKLIHKLSALLCVWSTVAVLLWAVASAFFGSGLV
ncbi:MAG: rhomboid family intramembrane serine protease [Gammaproteobacteria bacterium]